MTTFETETVAKFLSAASSRGLIITPIGLERPDIVCCLNPNVAVGQDSWQPLIDQFRTEHEKGFKHWLRERHNADLNSVCAIDRFLRDMQQQGRPFEGELIRKINEFSAQVIGQPERMP